MSDLEEKALDHASEATALLRVVMTASLRRAGPPGNDRMIRRALLERAAHALAEALDHVRCAIGNRTVSIEAQVDQPQAARPRPCDSCGLELAEALQPQAARPRPCDSCGLAPRLEGGIFCDLCQEKRDRWSELVDAAAARRNAASAPTSLAQLDEGRTFVEPARARQGVLIPPRSQDARPMRRPVIPAPPPTDVAPLVSGVCPCGAAIAAEDLEAGIAWCPGCKDGLDAGDQDLSEEA